MNAAAVVAEGQQDTERDPALQQVLLAAPPTYRTGRVTCSLELLQDSGFDVQTYLAVIFAKRLARGIGPALVSTLAAGVPATVTASGSSTNTGGTETGGTSVGSDDLFALMASLDPAYLSSEKAGWLMNWPTLIGLWKLRDKNGRLVFPTVFDDDGVPLLLGFRVGICPSLPNVGLSAKPIYFGALDYFCTRLVLPQAAVIPDHESKAEYGVATFRALLRGQGCLLVNSSSITLPIVGLKNAAS
jgi:HK97 family phage major capsid protein